MDPATKQLLEESMELLELVDDAKELLYAVKRRLSPDSPHYARITNVLLILDDIVE